MKGAAALSPLIEAFLFARGTPASLEELAKALGEDTVSVEKGLEYLKARYDKEEFGITLHRTGGGYTLATKKKYDSWLSSLLGKQTPLSPAAMETLAVIACREPVTRVEIEKIRGVSAGRVIALLMERIWWKKGEGWMCRAVPFFTAPPDGSCRPRA